MKTTATKLLTLAAVAITLAAANAQTSTTDRRVPIVGGGVIWVPVDGGGVIWVPLGDGT